jgi:hypothetical protein
LDFTYKLFTQAIYLIELIVGELPPLLFHMSFKALPISFNLVAAPISRRSAVLDRHIVARFELTPSSSSRALISESARILEPPDKEKERAGWPTLYQTPIGKKDPSVIAPYRPRSRGKRTAIAVGRRPRSSTRLIAAAPPSRRA